MNLLKGMGIFSIILGIIFIVCPILAASFVSFLVGLSLLFFGITTMISGIGYKSESAGYAISRIIIGLIALILGILFIFSYIDALSFLVTFELFIIGIIMIFVGISGIFSRINNISLATSILTTLLGIVAIILGFFTGSNPVVVAIIIGIVLVIEGISLLISD